MEKIQLLMKENNKNVATKETFLIRIEYWNNCCKKSQTIFKLTKNDLKIKILDINEITNIIII